MHPFLVFALVYGILPNMPRDAFAGLFQNPVNMVSDPKASFDCP